MGIAVFLFVMSVQNKLKVTLNAALIDAQGRVPSYKLRLCIDFSDLSLKKLTSNANILAVTQSISTRKLFSI